MKYAVWFIVICLLWVIPGKDCIAYAEERVIDIIYDNSGSMAFNETDKLGEADNYITRWVEADYAVRAFSALMEEGDKLYVFPMDRNKENVAGTPQENINYFQISSPNDGNIDKASENFGNTYYEGIHNAIAHLQAQSGERWIIILTDSEDKRLCEQALNQELRDVDWVKVLYVPIVEVPERLNLNAEVNNKVIQVEPKSGNIFSQILEATDYIYNRNSLTLSRETAGTVEFLVDAPIKELIVLMQAEGETIAFKNRTTTLTNESLKEKAESIRKEISAETGLLLKGDNSFQSYSNTLSPSYGGNQDFANNLKVKDIQGEMLSLDGKSKIDATHIYQKVIPVKANESINIYYQLELGLELELWQEGKRIEEGKLFEGSYEVVLYPINPNSGERVSVDAKLLEGVSVKLNGEACRFGEHIYMEASYPDTITLKAEAEGAALEEVVQLTNNYPVQERIYPFVIQVLEQPVSFDYNKMNRRSINNGEADAVHIKLLEDTGNKVLALRDTSMYYLGLEANISYKGLKKSEKANIEVEVVEVSGTGDEFLLYPVLTEEEDYGVYRDVKLNIFAYRTDNVEASRATQELSLALTAEKAELEAELLPAPSYSRKDLVSGKVLYSLVCNGEELSDKEKEKVSFQTLKGGNGYVNLSQKKSAGIWLKEQMLNLYWLYNNKKTIPIHTNITYVRRGVPCSAVLQGDIQVILAPLWLRVCLYIFTAIIFLFLLYILFNLLAGRCFLPFFKCTLYFNNDPELGIKIKPRNWLRCLAVPRRGITLRMSENQKEAYGVECPDLVIQKRKRVRYYLKNWPVFSKQDCFRINGRFIYRENAVMNKGDHFEFMDSGGLWHTIIFQESLAIREDGER